MDKFNSIKEIWFRYLKSINEDIDNTSFKYTSWYFGGNKEIANELVDLVLLGIKKATTSLYYFYEVENEEIPKGGDLSVITDFSGNAKCIIRTSLVKVMPFNEVSKEFAFKEGEGDKSLEYWRDVHIKFFNKELSEFKMKFSEDMLVVCEEFELVYKD